MSTPDQRPDPIAGILEVTSQAEQRQREQTKMLGTQLYVGRAYFLAAILIVALAMTLVLPHSRGVFGYDVLFRTEVAAAQGTTLPSFLFVLLYTVGTVIFGMIMVITQKWWAAGIAWCLTCVSALYGMLAIWLRQSGRGADPNLPDFGPPAIGIYLSWALVLVLAIVLAMVLWSKTPEAREHEAKIREGGD